jgi:hypothetical protein
MVGGTASHSGSAAPPTAGTGPRHLPGLVGEHRSGSHSDAVEQPPHPRFTGTALGHVEQGRQPLLRGQTRCPGPDTAPASAARAGHRRRPPPRSGWPTPASPPKRPAPGHGSAPATTEPAPSPQPSRAARMQHPRSPPATPAADAGPGHPSRPASIRTQPGPQAQEMPTRTTPTIHPEPGPSGARPSGARRPRVPLTDRFFLPRPRETGDIRRCKQRPGVTAPIPGRAQHLDRPPPGHSGRSSSGSTAAAEAAEKGIGTRPRPLRPDQS